MTTRPLLAVFNEGSYWCGACGVEMMTDEQAVTLYGEILVAETCLRCGAFNALPNVHEPEDEGG